MTTVFGIDACRGGWVGIALSDGAFTGAYTAATLDALLDQVPDAEVVGVDIPLGLADTGVRAAERLVQSQLGRRASSLFLMPPRRVFDEPDHRSATALSTTLTGKGISIQAWGLKTKILEADAVYARRVLFEVHPELTFLQLGLRHEDGSKKTWRGQRARLRVLAAAGVALPEDLGPDVARVPADDVLDAAAVAWTAQRIATGTARCFPDPPERNTRGQSMAIWC
jgi:predicted RNase H-like nuclease